MHYLIEQNKLTAEKKTTRQISRQSSLSLRDLVVYENILFQVEYITGWVIIITYMCGTRESTRSDAVRSKDSLYSAFSPVSSGNY